MIRLATIALALFATSAHAELPWPVAARRVNAIAVDGERAYLATGDNHAELVVVDLETGVTLGTFDADGSADALSVHVLEPGVVKLGRRWSDAPEVYQLDVSDPTSIVVLEAGERARHVRWKPDPIPPVRFSDANGDGVFRLGCLGDSNTAHPAGSAEKWCEKLATLIGDPRFEVVNVAVSGATVTERSSRSTATEQLEAMLAYEPDALVLAFGTNDRMLGGTPAEIRDAYQVIADVAGLPTYVATTPPAWPCMADGCPLIAAQNALLYDAFEGRTVDFFGGMQRADMLDALHFNAAGQELRAERVLAVIGSPLRVSAFLTRPSR